MSFTSYISIDVATKSLAIGIYKLRSFRDISAGSNIKNPIACNAYCDESIQIIMMDVFDINDGKCISETTICEKAISLKRVLSHVDAVINNSKACEVDATQVLIEYQMNANHASNAIFNMITYHFADKYPTHIVKPSLKNTIALHPMLTLAKFLEYSTSNYKANKQHTTYNMIYLLTVFDKLHFISHIKKKNHDDIADTLCQCLAWHRQHS